MRAEHSHGGINANKPPNCSLCHSPAGARPVRDTPEFQGSTYWQCRACGSIFLWPLPPEEKNAAFETPESAQALDAADELRTALLQRRLDLAGKPAPAARLLDVGCGTGALLALAAEAGWTVTGIEMSPPLAALAREKLPGAQIYQADLLSPHLSDFLSFEAVMALDVLEHVLNPRAALARLFDWTAPGGRLILHTPNAASLRSRLHGGRWNMLIPEYHFHLFSPSALKKMLLEAGFTCVTLTTASGTGLETGLARHAARAREAALRAGNFGNALLAVARR